MKKLGVVAGLLVLCAVVYYGVTLSEKPTPATGSGAQMPGGRQPAADFQLTDLEGSPLQLSALRGKVVLLDFWATWCPPCVAEIPHFRDLSAAYKSKGLEVIGISLDEGGETAVRPFLKKHGVQYRIALGNPQIIRAYGGIRGIPTTFLIDKKGRVAQKYVGYREKQEFERQIQTLLAE